MEKLSSLTLTNWAVNYDNIYGMPIFIQGIIVGGEHSGRPIQIDNIISLDLAKKIVKTKSGEFIFLIGEGSRLFIIKDGDIKYLNENFKVVEKQKNNDK